MKAVGYYQSLPIDHPDALLDLELQKKKPGGYQGPPARPAGSRPGQGAGRGRGGRGTRGRARQMCIRDSYRHA
ncbi:hypothetical protein, partial [Achromobacter ruhlandii]|uniref:hypothetical protein n=1 Tax=Achromobacter ruhlandii TaxID=72557 RepID=UPI001B8CC228